MIRNLQVTRLSTSEPLAPGCPGVGGRAGVWKPSQRSAAVSNPRHCFLSTCCKLGLRSIRSTPPLWWLRVGPCVSRHRRETKAGTCTLPVPGHRANDQTCHRARQSPSRTVSTLVPVALHVTVGPGHSKVSVFLMMSHFPVPTNPHANTNTAGEDKGDLEYLIV